MATIGLKDLYYSIITEDSSGNETYATPVKLAPAISASLSLNFDAAKLFADDKVEDDLREFSTGTISLGVSAISDAVAAILTGSTVDSNGCLVDTDSDAAPYVAIGFRAKTSKETYRYVWLYRVKFAVPNDSFSTKGESVAFTTPTIEGTFYKRNKADSRGRHPWRYSVTEGEVNGSASTIAAWFNSVPEPTFSSQ